MSWLSKFFKKGFTISWNFGWMGEKDEPAWEEPKTVTKEEIQKEIKK